MSEIEPEIIGFISLKKGNRTIFIIFVVNMHKVIAA